MIWLWYTRHGWILLQSLCAVGLYQFTLRRKEQRTKLLHFIGFPSTRIAERNFNGKNSLYGLSKGASFTSRFITTTSTAAGS